MSQPTTKINNRKTFLSTPALLGNSLISGLLSLVVAIPLGFHPLLAPLFSEKDNSALAQQPANPLPQKTEKFEYPQEVIRTFMKGCGFTNNREFCTCSLDGLRSQYSFEDFLKIDKAARETKQVPQEVINIFQACRPKDAS